MLTQRQELSVQEESVMRALLLPYGVELTSTDIIRRSGGILKGEGMVLMLEKLELRGYLRSRFVLQPGYLIRRKVFALNHSRLYKESNERLKTRVILDRILQFKIPA